MQSCKEHADNIIYRAIRSSGHVCVTRNLLQEKYNKNIITYLPMTGTGNMSRAEQCSVGRLLPRRRSQGRLVWTLLYWQQGVIILHYNNPVNLQ
jgi:hypothetical protein